MKDDRLYVIYILECMSRIEQYTAGGRKVFMRDSKTQDAVLRNLQTRSETIQRVSPATKSAHAELDWKALAGFRNVLVHDYLGINLVSVRVVVEHRWPAIKGQFSAILQQLENKV